MKRSLSDDYNCFAAGDSKMKKIKSMEEEEDREGSLLKQAEAVLLDENLMYEVLKHVDARTLATAACVSRQWHRTAQDERLWELICTKHSTNIGCSSQQLRSVVLVLGGFRNLFSLYLRPLSNPPNSSSASSSGSSSAWPCLPPPSPVTTSRSTTGKTRWGKDEVHLSLSLLSIRYYEKMNFNNRNKC